MEPGHTAYIHKNEFKRYLQIKKAWPVDGLLANWWDVSANNKREAGYKDKLRTVHAKELVNKNDYKGGMPDKTIIAILQADKPELWGNTDSTFKKWIQRDEAKKIFPNKRRKYTP
jgi:hypothetical protein